MTAGFERIQAKFARCRGPARCPEIEKGRPAGNSNGGGNNTPAANGRYSTKRRDPFDAFRTYSEGNILSVSVPTIGSNLARTQACSSHPRAPTAATASHAALCSARGRLRQSLAGHAELPQRHSPGQQLPAAERQLVASHHRRPSRLYDDAFRPLTRHRTHRDRHCLHDPNTQRPAPLHRTVVPEIESYYYSNTFANVLNSIRLND